MKDQLFGFSFDAAPIQGRYVSLSDSWVKIRDRQRHAPEAERLLGEMVAIVAMLAQGIKLDGSVILQIRGHGAISSAMAECTDRTRLRGMLRDATNPSSTASGAGQLAITLKPHRGEMYQGIVGIAAGSVSSAVESYFAASEQLPTRIWAAAAPDCVAALLLQRLPPRSRQAPSAPEIDVDAWQRVQLLADTVTDQELLTVPVANLLGRLFATETVRLQAPTAMAFGCTCSRQRTANALKILGRAEIDSILDQEGAVTVTCEFCGTRYGYDAIDARLLFEPLAPAAPETPQ